MNTIEQLARLEKLGLKQAHRRVTSNLEFIRKLHTAYQNYEFVREEDIKEFRKNLRKETTVRKRINRYSTRVRYDTLEFINIRDYLEVPPTEVLTKLEQATESGCFDAFEVAKISSVVATRTKDPILFGRILNCGDRFVIAQWGNDVTVEMIRKVLKEKDILKE